MTLSFDPASFPALFGEMSRRAVAITGKSLTENSDVLTGYLRDLAADAIKTGDQVVHGAIDEQTARTIFQMQVDARRSVATLAELSVYQTAQSIMDMATGLVTDAIYSRTGIDIRG